MIDKNKLFNLFDDSPQQETISSRKSLDDFIKSPFAKIGMFTKLILNHFVFHEKSYAFNSNKISNGIVAAVVVIVVRRPS